MGNDFILLLLNKWNVFVLMRKVNLRILLKL